MTVDTLSLGAELASREVIPAADRPAQSAATPASPSLTLADVEREHILAVLKRTHGVIEGPNGAALLLNMNPSTTRYRIKKLGITRDQYR